MLDGVDYRWDKTPLIPPFLLLLVPFLNLKLDQDIDAPIVRVLYCVKEHIPGRSVDDPVLSVAFKSASRSIHPNTPFYYRQCQAWPLFSPIRKLRSRHYDDTLIIAQLS